MGDLKSGWRLRQACDGISQRLQKKLARFGPLSVAAALFVFCFILFFGFRCVLTALYWERVSATPQFWKLFVLGFRMDAITTTYLFGVLALAPLLVPKAGVHRVRHALALYGAVAVAVVVGMELSTIPFVAEYDLRPDRIFFEYLKYPKEVFGTVLTERPIAFAIMVAALVLSGGFFYRLNLANLEGYRPWGWRRRAVAFPLVAGVLFLAARSSIGHRPANISTAAFSSNNLVNEITLNSTYSLGYAIYRIRHEKAPTSIYGKMPFSEAVAEVKKHMAAPESDFIANEIPLLHRQPAGVKRERPANVVIFLQESLGAEFVGALGGPAITPNLDRLSREGLWFTELYSTGTRTVRGIEATIAGFLPTPGSSVVKLGLSRRGFFTAGALFSKHGYETMFVYGGMANFDEMRSFFLGNGFQHVYDEPTFSAAQHKGIWGVSDEDLVVGANEIFKKQKKPFFAVLLSTTNHLPFDYPPGRIEPYEQPAGTMRNAMKFADYAIGKLFELARKEDYYKDTIFVVLADHNTRVYGDELVPVHKFHIPGLIVGPGVPKQAYTNVASQIDILPTVLHFTGLETVHSMIGRNLMTMPAEIPGRAIMQFSENHGYLVNDKLVVHLRYQQPTEFTYDFVSHKLSPIPVEAPLEHEALAHAMLPWDLYAKQLYRLPR